MHEKKLMHSKISAYEKKLRHSKVSAREKKLRHSREVRTKKFATGPLSRDSNMYITSEECMSNGRGGVQSTGRGCANIESRC